MNTATATATIIVPDLSILPVEVLAPFENEIAQHQAEIIRIQRELETKAQAAADEALIKRAALIESLPGQFRVTSIGDVIKILGGSLPSAPLPGPTTAQSVLHKRIKRPMGRAAARIRPHISPEKWAQIDAALKAGKGSVAHHARMFGVGESTLWRRKHDLGLTTTTTASRRIASRKPATRQPTERMGTARRFSPSQRLHIIRRLKEAHPNIAAIAKEMGSSREAVYAILRAEGLALPSERPLIAA